jgi:hypothetical protein
MPNIADLEKKENMRDSQLISFMKLLKYVLMYKIFGTNCEKKIRIFLYVFVNLIIGMF